MKKKLAVAFDFESREDFFRALDLLQNLSVVCKVGLRLLPLLTEGDFKKIKDHFELFIDAKLHDIPSQVQGAVRSWAHLGADYLTCHLSGGGKMLELAQEEAQKHGVKLLGVSVLTSLSEQDLLQMKVPKPEEWVQTLVSLGFEKSLRGFVLSGHELRILKSQLPDSAIEWAVPGLSLESQTEQSFDQSRMVSLKEALRWGVTLPVMGRAIWTHQDPQKKVEEILMEIHEV